MPSHFGFYLVYVGCCDVVPGREDGLIGASTPGIIVVHQPHHIALCLVRRTTRSVPEVCYQRGSKRGSPAIYGLENQVWWVKQHAH